MDNLTLDDRPKQRRGPHCSFLPRPVPSPRRTLRLPPPCIKTPPHLYGPTPNLEYHLRPVSNHIRHFLFSPCPLADPTALPPPCIKLPHTYMAQPQTSNLTCAQFLITFGKSRSREGRTVLHASPWREIARTAAVPRSARPSRPSHPTPPPPARGGWRGGNLDTTKACADIVVGSSKKVFSSTAEGKLATGVGILLDLAKGRSAISGGGRIGPGSTRGSTLTASPRRSISYGKKM